MKIFIYLLCILLLVGCPGLGSEEDSAPEITEEQKQIATKNLFNAVFTNDLSLLNKSLKEGAYVNAKDEAGDTALMNAALYGLTEIVRVLLAAPGINKDSKDSDGYTALMDAAEEGHTDIIQTLIDNGVDVNAKDKDGWTALMFAAGFGYMDIVQLLIEADADVNTEDKDGYTALTLADKEGHTKIVNLLKNAGAVE